MLDIMRRVCFHRITPSFLRDAESAGPTCAYRSSLFRLDDDIFELRCRLPCLLNENTPCTGPDADAFTLILCLYLDGGFILYFVLVDIALFESTETDMHDQDDVFIIIIIGEAFPLDSFLVIVNALVLVRLLDIGIV